MALTEILEESDPEAFVFGEDELRWRGRVLPAAESRPHAREFAHSFGSCSFEEPVADLQKLELLP